MQVGKRLLALLFFLLSVVGLLLSLTGGIGVWLVKEPVTARATRVFERLEGALDSAERHLGQMKASLVRAAARLESTREEHVKMSQQPQPNSALRRGLAQKVQRSLGPELGDAEAKLHTVGEAAVVVNSVLADMGTIPFLASAGLDMERLTELKKGLAEVGPAAWELSRLLGDPEPDADAGTQLSGIDRGLQTLQRQLAEFELRVREARQRTEQLQTQTFAWITIVTVSISAVCIWIAVSQVSILCHAWSWWKGVGGAM